jgi:hypothetical protein
MACKLRKLTLLTALAISGAAFSAANASAADICVGTSPLCPVQNYAATAAGFDSALTAAQDGSHPGHDRIILAAATYSVGAGLNYGASTGQSLDIIGQGDTTILQPTAPGLVTLYLNWVNAPNSSITGIKFAGYAGSESGIPYALSMRQGEASHLTFDIPARAVGDNYGLQIYGGLIRDSKFTLGGGSWGVLMASNSAASGLTMTGDPTKQNYGVKGQGGTDYSVTHSTFKDITYAIYSDQGKFTVSDTLIDLGAINGAYGAWPHNTNGGAYTVGLDATNLTVVGTGANQYGLRTEVAGFNSSTMTVRDSIISLSAPTASELYCSNTNSPSSTASMSVGYSLLALSQVSATAGCNSSIAPSVVDRAAVANPFVDQVAKNFALSASSPAIDAGDPAFAVQAGAKDLAGNPRVVATKDGCVPRVALGAYESQAAAVCVPPPPSTPALSVKFGKVVGRFKIAKKAKAFKVVTKKPKSRLPITASAKVKLKLTLKKGKKAVKGSQSVTVPAGTSYLTFSGKFAGKTLPPGKYTLSVTAPGLQDAPKSALSLIR